MNNLVNRFPANLSKLAPNWAYKPVSFVDRRSCCGETIMRSAEPTADFSEYRAEMIADGGIVFVRYIDADCDCEIAVDE